MSLENGIRKFLSTKRLPGYDIRKLSVFIRLFFSRALNGKEPLEFIDARLKQNNGLLKKLREYFFENKKHVYQDS